MCVDLRFKIVIYVFEIANQVYNEKDAAEGQRGVSCSTPPTGSRRRRLKSVPPWQLQFDPGRSEVLNFEFFSSSNESQRLQRLAAENSFCHEGNDRF